jgi:hypothetical protein
MSDISSRPPVTIVSTKIEYDESLTRRRKISMIATMVFAVIIVVVCGCMACSMLTWINSLASQITAK